MRNTYIFNCEVQINYTARYIYFINFSYFLKASKNDFLDSNSQYKQYLLINLINCFAVNKLSAKDFMFLYIDCLDKIVAIQYIMSEVVDCYFTKAI